MGGFVSSDAVLLFFAFSGLVIGLGDGYLAVQTLHRWGGWVFSNKGQGGVWKMGVIFAYWGFLVIMGRGRVDFGSTGGRGVERLIRFVFASGFRPPVFTWGWGVLY